MHIYKCTKILNIKSIITNVHCIIILCHVILWYIIFLSLLQVKILPILGEKKIGEITQKAHRAGAPEHINKLFKGILVTLYLKAQFSLLTDYKLCLP